MVLCINPNIMTIINDDNHTMIVLTIDDLRRSITDKNIENDFQFYQKINKFQPQWKRQKT